MSADALQTLLSIDPLLEAEKATGKSYKDDTDTMALGFAQHMLLNETKQKVLTSVGDTHYNTDLANTLAVFARLGFEEVYSEEFEGRGYSQDGPQPWERFLVFWHPDGILGKVESWQTVKRNTAEIYYNWRPNDDVEDYWSRTSSGGFNLDAYDNRNEKIWVGHHDVREAMAHKVTRLREAGTFVSPWIERPFLWLLTYMDTRVEDYDYREINAKRIARLPQHVQDALGPKDD